MKPDTLRRALERQGIHLRRMRPIPGGYELRIKSRYGWLTVPVRGLGVDASPGTITRAAVSAACAAVDKDPGPVDESIIASYGGMDWVADQAWDSYDCDGLGRGLTRWAEVAGVEASFFGNETMKICLALEEQRKGGQEASITIDVEPVFACLVDSYGEGADQLRTVARSLARALLRLAGDEEGPERERAGGFLIAAEQDTAAAINTIERRKGAEPTRLFWVSFAHPPEQLTGWEYAGPWWVTNFGPGLRNIVALIRAANPEDARAQIIRCMPGKQEPHEWRFVDEKPASWEPFCERFPRQAWMQWPAPAAPRGLASGVTEPDDWADE